MSTRSADFGMIFNWNSALVLSQMRSDDASLPDTIEVSDAVSAFEEPRRDLLCNSIYGLFLGISLSALQKAGFVQPDDFDSREETSNMEIEENDEPGRRSSDTVTLGVRSVGSGSVAIPPATGGEGRGREGVAGGTRNRTVSTVCPVNFPFKVQAILTQQADPSILIHCQSGLSGSSNYINTDPPSSSSASYPTNIPRQ